MHPKQETSFFLYDMGLSPDVLRLGSLFLKDYANPSKSRHYTHPPLRQVISLTEAEQSEHASSITFDNCLIHTKSSRGFGFSIDAAGIASPGLEWKASDEKILRAQEGTRVELKEPEDFFEKRVLQHRGEAEDKLRLWLSASSSEYVLKMMGLRRPKIWMLTGQYLLKDTQIIHATSGKQQGSISTGALAVGALTGVPVGGSINISPDVSQKFELRTPDKLVWAAQYHRLKMNYVRARSGEIPEFPRVIDIYPNALRTGNVLRGEPDQPLFAQVAIDDAVSGATEETDDDDEESAAYEKALEDAVETFEDFFGEDES